MPRSKKPKVRLKKAQKNALKAAKDGAKAFIREFTKDENAALPKAGGV